MSTSSPDTASGASTRSPVPDLVVSCSVIVLGVTTLLLTRTITVPLSSNVVGPRVFPYAVGVVLTLAGIAVLIDTLRGRLGESEDGEDVDVDASTDWAALARIVAAFSAHVVLVDLIGWALAGALLFTLVAWSLGADLRRATVAGLIIGFVVQGIFVTALGVTLPAGPFEGVPFLDG